MSSKSWNETESHLATNWGKQNQKSRSTSNSVFLSFRRRSFSSTNCEFSQKKFTFRCRQNFFRRLWKKLTDYWAIYVSKVLTGLLSFHAHLHSLPLMLTTEQSQELWLCRWVRSKNTHRGLSNLIFHEFFLFFL